MKETLNTAKTLVNVWVPRVALGVAIGTGAIGTAYEGYQAVTAFADQKVNEASAEAYQTSKKPDLAAEHAEAADRSAELATTAGVATLVGAATTTALVLGTRRRRKQSTGFMPHAQSNGYRAGVPTFANN